MMEEVRFIPRGRSVMANCYSFGWSHVDDPDAVQCPELDALVHDVIAVFGKHGAGIDLEGGYDESPKIVLVPYDRADFAWLTAHLDDSRGIPWLDKAREHYRANKDARYKLERQAKAAAELAAKEAQEQAAHDAVLKHGIIIAGKKYRLVPAED
jgi:hypothetical protein